MAVPDGAVVQVDEEEARTTAYAHALEGLSRAAAEPGLSEPQRSAFVRLRTLAASGAGRRPLAPAP